MSVLWVCVSVLYVFHSCKGETRHVYSPGDIVIGGLFHTHLKTNRSVNSGPLVCHDFDIRGFLLSQVMIYTIREINQRTPRVLPNFTIGYDIYDTCSDVGLAISATLRLLETRSDNQSCGRIGHGEPATKVVVGEASSETSIAVARIVSLTSVAQISYSATSELLSRKYKFPTFLRTVSSDAHQTKGISELVRKFNWKAVAIVGSDDEYGRYGSDSLSDHFSAKGVCVEFMKILPGYFNLKSNKSSRLLVELVKRLTNSSAEAIILFTKSTNAEIIMMEAIKYKLNRTWIASDAWSTSTKIAKLPDIKLAGQVFGFTFQGREVPGFKNYILTSQFDKKQYALMGDYRFCTNQSSENMSKDCLLADDQHQPKKCLDSRCLIDFIDKAFSYSIYLAVEVIADSLRRLMKCDSQQCERTSNFTALELLEEIKKTNCTVNTTVISFDENGDPNLAYNIVYWNSSDAKRGTVIKTIGGYWPNGSIKLPDELEKAMAAVEVTVYNCSKTCKPGLELKTPHETCCAYCAPCAEREFSPGNGTACQSCNDTQYSKEGHRDKCFPITDQYLRWKCSFSIVLSCFAISGIIITILCAILFTVYRGTPIVKAVGGCLCLLELLSLLACFCLTFTFHGKPTRDSCRLGLPLFGVAFSLCISCILANLLQILVSFDFNIKVASWMKKLNQPCAVVTVVSGIQLILSVLWMVFEPPVPYVDAIDTESVHKCKLLSVRFFAATIGYLTFWAFICFLFAVKGKKLPDLYKNAALISVSMLLFIIIWIIFIPLFLTMKGKNKAAVEIVAILISSYSILGFHLAPKCYIMLFRKELNNENAITSYIKKYYEQQGRAVIKS